MKNDSIWELENFKFKSSKIFTDKADIVIVGAGITGVTLSYFLMNSNKKIVLLDKGKAGMGVTSKTTAKISYLQNNIYSRLGRYFDSDISRLYFESQMEGINIIKKIISDNEIDCDLKEEDTYLFTNKLTGIVRLNSEKRILTKYGVKCYYADKLPISFSVRKTFYVKDCYSFHPLKYIYGLLNIVKDRIDIFEDTIVSSIKKESNSYLVFTSNGIIKAKKVVVACHYPFFVKPGLIPLKSHIEREYVSSGKYIFNSSFSAINIGGEIKSLRFYKDNLIYTTNSQRITNNLNYKKEYEISKKEYEKSFDKEPLYTWINQDIVTNDRLPIIGRLYKNNSSFLIATGYNGWGMTNGVLASKILSDLIMNRKNRYVELFNPRRINYYGIFNSIVDGILYIKSYIHSLFYKTKTYCQFKLNRKRYNLYIDENGIKHIVRKKCPHMGCNLLLNEEEYTWDCPCHGSRYDIDGKVIEGPSNKDIRM